MLARLPAVNPETFRIGHFTRKIPQGYVEGLVSGKPALRDRKLDTYLQKLYVVTRGDLFSLDRLIEIWRLNTGVYDDLIHFDYHGTETMGFT